MSATATWDRLRDLPVRVEGLDLDTVDQDLAGTHRRTTVVRLRGGGFEGQGEDVAWDPAAHDDFARRREAFDIAGSWTLDALSRRIESLPLYAGEPSQDAYPHYRRWALESAALDLGLRQAGRSLGDVLDRRPRPLTFVVSTGLGSPPTVEALERRLAHDPGMKFKIDYANDWTDAVLDRLVALDAIVTVDLKGHYRKWYVGPDADPPMYRRIARALPDAWIEDPDLTGGEAVEALSPYADRITWDAPIHAVEDLARQRIECRCVNVKPSRFGSIRELLRFYDHCDERGIAMYGGGQSEGGPGRRQAQTLASLFHPDGWNDLAPSEHNVRIGPDLPRSPLEPDAFAGSLGPA